MEPTTTRSSHFFFILALLLNACDYSHAMGIREKEEPQCNSRFEYEYKVLQKLVELETSQKELQDTIILHEETLEKRDETITALETSQKALQETIKIQGDVIAAQAVKLEDYDLVLKETTSSLDEVRVKINETDRELKETVSSLGDARTKINELEHKDMAGSRVGFTVTSPKDNTNPRIFQTVVYNSEPGFNTATGKFICQHPGIYLFTATVIRESNTSEVSCYISVNGLNKLRAIANNSNSRYSGFPSGTATLVVHLSVGDEVYLTGCSRTYMYSESSFSGVLIVPRR